MITFQQSKVRTFEKAGDRVSAPQLADHLEVFAHDLLDVLAGDVSLALNRLAIGQASRDGSKLGDLLLERGRRQIDRRARGLIEAGRRSGYLRFDDAEEAYRSFTVSSFRICMCACCWAGAGQGFFRPGEEGGRRLSDPLRHGKGTFGTQRQTRLTFRFRQLRDKH